MSSGLSSRRCPAWQRLRHTAKYVTHRITRGVPRCIERIAHVEVVGRVKDFVRLSSDVREAHNARFRSRA